MASAYATPTDNGARLTVTNRQGETVAGLDHTATAALIFDLIKCLPDGHVLRNQYNL